jgi:ATP-dependent exoDNAse (exonuclease V) alpha subunit
MVGDYVRTRWGCIAKFEGIHEGFYEFDNIIMDESSAVREELFVDIVEKSSPNIIDLIEVGDYVNGHRVNYINKDREHFNISFGDEDFNLKSKFNSDIYWLSKEDIKSIVTKEQFESMEYKIGE